MDGREGLLITIVTYLQLQLQCSRYRQLFGLQHCQPFLSGISIFNLFSYFITFSIIFSNIFIAPPEIQAKGFKTGFFNHPPPRVNSKQTVLTFVQTDIGLEQYTTACFYRTQFCFLDHFESIWTHSQSTQMNNSGMFSSLLIL